MGIEINHLIVPAKDRKASARFLGEISASSPAPQSSRTSSRCRLAASRSISPIRTTCSRCTSRLVDEATFDAGYTRPTGAGHRHLRRPDAEPTR